MATVGMIVPETVIGHTQGKFLRFAQSLKQQGYDVVCVVWSENTEAAVKGVNLPFLRVRAEMVLPDRIGEAKKVHALLDRGMDQHHTAPTWGDILAYDDVVGMASGVKVEGFGGFAPDCVVWPMNGVEEATVEDEQMRLILWRFTKANRIPTLGIEIQTLQVQHRVCLWPVDLLLTKEPRMKSPFAQTVFPMSPAYRYCGTFRNEPHIEKFLDEEEELRRQIGWEPGKRYLLMPFHIYYTAEIIQVLQGLAKYGQEMQEQGIRFLWTCSAHTFRRGLTERDLILHGLAKWLRPFGEMHVVEGANLLQWVWLAEAVMVPFAHSMKENFRGMGVRVLERAEEVKDLMLYVSVGEGVAWLLDGRNGRTSEKKGAG